MSLARILVVVAHPDDEVLGCGGTMARLAREGHEVHVAILGEGITSRYAKREKADRSKLDALRKDSRMAAKRLGARSSTFDTLPDNRFDSVPLLELAKAVETVIENISPDVIYTNHGGDLNIDHALVYRAVLTATRPLPGCAVKEVYAFEVPSSTEWAFSRLSPAFHANVFVDIAATLEDKIAAMSLYRGEVRPFPHPRSPEALKAIAQRWGSVSGLKAAEAFELVRAIRTSAA